MADATAFTIVSRQLTALKPGAQGRPAYAATGLDCGRLPRSLSAIKVEMLFGGKGAVQQHPYSVPHRLLREQIEARVTARTIELFHKGERVAVHLRGGLRGRHTTLPEHMPRAHRRHAEWTIERIRQEAAAIGTATTTLADLILRSRPHPEQGFRACLNILRLVRSFGRDRVEAACARGLEIGARSYGSVQSILRHGLGRQAASAARSDELPLVHPNIRGSSYYH